MENRNLLEIEIGNMEFKKIEPKPVKIKAIRVDPVADKTGDGIIGSKVVFTCEHPDVETIEISSVKYENKGKLTVSGLWYNLDKDQKIQKGSALAHLMTFIHIRKLQEAIGLENIQTLLDDKGYICFKAY